MSLPEPQPVSIKTDDFLRPPVVKPNPQNLLQRLEAVERAFLNEQPLYALATMRQLIIDVQKTPHLPAFLVAPKEPLETDGIPVSLECNAPACKWVGTATDVAYRGVYGLYCPKCARLSLIKQGINSNVKEK